MGLQWEMESQSPRVSSMRRRMRPARSLTYLDTGHYHVPGSSQGAVNATLKIKRGNAHEKKYRNLHRDSACRLRIVQRGFRTKGNCPAGSRGEDGQCCRLCSGDRKGQAALEEYGAARPGAGVACKIRRTRSRNGCGEHRVSKHGCSCIRRCQGECEQRIPKLAEGPRQNKNYCFG